MDKLVSTSLIEMIKYYLDDEQKENLNELFKSYEALEVSRLRGAYSRGALDCISGVKDTDSYIENKYGICEQ